MIFSKDKKLSPSFKKNATITGVGATAVVVSLTPLALLPVIGIGTLVAGGGAVAYGGKKLLSQFTSGEDIVQDATLSPREQERKDRLSKAEKASEERKEKAEARKKKAADNRAKRKSRLSK